MKITSNKPVHGKQMTLGELAAFVAHARACDVPDSAAVFVKVNFGSGLREVTADSDKQLHEPPVGM